MPLPRITCSVSVIIPALNECERIERAVRQAWRAGADQVIVADGGSLDGTADLARRHQAMVVLSPPGRARQQNFGATLARGDVLVFQHADNWLADRSLHPLKTIAPHQVGRLLGAFHQQLDGSGWGYRLVQWGNRARAEWLQMPYGDQAIFVGRPLFDRCQGFPDVPLMEDVLFIDRARQYARIRMLPGPLHVDIRRWMRHGLLRQTARNWSLLLALRCGVPPQRLASYYRRHDRKMVSQ